MFERLEASDIDRCMDLAVRVGWPRERAKWELLFAIGRVHGARVAEGALGAMVVINEHERASVVAMMVVDPDRQGRGLGRRLLEHALASAVEPVLLYATPKGRPLYERLGFVEVDRVHKLVGAPRTVRPAAERPVASASERAAVVEADARAFGSRRARLLEALCERGRLVTDDRGGFAIRWNNGHLEVIGPVVAESEEAAIAFVDEALAGSTGIARVDVPVSSPRVAAHVRDRLGLEELERSPLLVRAPASLPGDRRRYHAIALQAFG